MGTKGGEIMDKEQLEKLLSDSYKEADQELLEMTREWKDSGDTTEELLLDWIRVVRAQSVEIVLEVLRKSGVLD